MGPHYLSFTLYTVDPYMESVLQVHIPEDRDYEQVTGYEVEIDEHEYGHDQDTRLLLFSRGGDIKGGEGLYTIQNDESGNHQRVVISDPNTATGYFLHGCEIHGLPEEAMYEHLVGEAPDLMEEYVEWNSELDPRDRRLRLMDLADLRIENGDFAAERYFDEEINWRSTNLDESGIDLAQEIAQTIEIKPRMCYWTAQHAAMKHIDNHRVEYVEGLCLPKEAGQCIRHAWIEIDGEVAELTWPWHMFDAREAQYLGVQISSETVKETRERRDVNGAIVLTDEEVATVGGKMSS